MERVERPEPAEADSGRTGRTRTRTRPLRRKTRGFMYDVTFCQPATFGTNVWLKPSDTLSLVTL